MAVVRAGGPSQAEESRAATTRTQTITPTTAVQGLAGQGGGFHRLLGDQELEDKLRGQLQGASVIRRACDSAEVRRVSHVITRLSENGVVRSIEALRTEFKLHPVPHRELTEHRKIQVPDRNGAQAVSSQVAEGIV